LSGLPWFRLYAEMASDAKIQMLAFEDQRHYVMLLCLECNGTLGASVPSDAYRERLVAKGLGLDTAASAEVKRRLIEGGLIGNDWHPLKWQSRQFKSDHDAAERKRNQRARKRESDYHNNVTTTNRDSHALEQNRADTDSEQRNPANETVAPRETEAEIRQHVMLIKAKWPKGCAHEDWITAEKLIRNLVTAGESWEAIEPGVERYAAFCKATGRLVANPGRWFGEISRPWLSPWTIPPKPGEKPAPNHDATWAEARWTAKEIGFRDPYPTESAAVYATEVRQARDVKPKTPLAERRGLAGIKRVAK
jgi:hypothetical protein